jgi:DNA-binding CsgD family transcriptional regulator
MLNSSLYDTLPSLINGIGQRHFYDQIAYSIKALDPISNIRIVSYSKTNHPVFLSGNEMSEIDEVYCESAYLLDPVYDMICSNQDQIELFTLDSLVNDDFRNSAYYDTFYQRLDWCNETNIVIGTNDDTKICIAYSTKDNGASIQAVNRELIPCISSIKAAILTHERVGRLLQQNQTIEHESTTHKSHHYLDELNLTKREKEIVGLILEGMSSVSIAEKCFVSEGTVKNHRKNIYRKLNIKSQAELFRNFIQ